MRLGHSLIEKLGELYALGQQYVESVVELQKLRFKERSSLVLANFITAFLIFSVVAMFILLGSLALALYLSEWLGSPGLGFLLVALLYLIIALVIFWFRRPLIVRPVLHMVIQSLRDENEDDNEETQAEHPDH